MFNAAIFIFYIGGLYLDVNFPTNYGNYGTHGQASPAQRLNLPKNFPRNRANPHDKEMF